MANPIGNVATRQIAEQTLCRTLSFLFLATSAFGAIGLFSGWPGQAFAEVIWIALGLALTVMWMNRNLPLQNVLLAMAILASLGFVAVLAVEASNAGNHMTMGLASTLSPALAKYMQAAAWALLLLNAHGVARLLAAGRESSPIYGLWMLGIASALVCGFQVGLEAALSVPSNKTWAMKAATLVGWYCFALLCLALASPAQLKRKSGPRMVSIEPSWVWIGLNLFVMATATKRGLWQVAAFQAAIGALGVWSARRVFGTR